MCDFECKGQFHFPFPITDKTLGTDATIKSKGCIYVVYDHVGKNDG